MGSPTLFHYCLFVEFHVKPTPPPWRFHFPSVEPGYLAVFRDAIQSAGIEFYTLLIDEGDLTHPDPAKRERALALILHWIEVAAQVGAGRVRVIAGLAKASEETLRLSETGLHAVLKYADKHGIEVVTANWHPLLENPAKVIELLVQMQGRLGLKLDFGNWGGERKYDDLAKIAPQADCTHAKAAYLPSGEMDHADFLRCLDICRDANFTGPHILIFSDAGDEWENLDKMRDIVLPYLAPPELGAGGRM